MSVDLVIVHTLARLAESVSSMWINDALELIKNIIYNELIVSNS